MAVKKRKLKKLKMQETIKKSIKIACKDCALRKTCKMKDYKEKSEKLKITTHCTLAIKNRNKRNKK